MTGSGTCGGLILVMLAVLLVAAIIYPYVKARNPKRGFPSTLSLPTGIRSLAEINIRQHLSLNVVQSYDLNLLEGYAEQCKEFGWMKDRIYAHTTKLGTIYAMQLYRWNLKEQV